MRYFLNLITGKIEISNKNLGLNNLLYQEINKKPSFVTDGLIQHLIGGVGVVGNVWQDQSGNGNDATMVNSPTVNADNIELDGISQYVKTNTGLSITNYSISIYVEFLSVSANDRMISSGGNSQTRLGDKISITKIFFWIPGGWQYVNVNLSLNSRYNITYVHSNNQLKVYVDAVLVGVVNENIEMFDISIGGKYLSSSGTTANINIFDSKIYQNKALTQQEITQNFNAL